MKLIRAEKVIGLRLKMTGKIIRELCVMLNCEPKHINYKLKKYKKELARYEEEYFISHCYILLKFLKEEGFEFNVRRNSNNKKYD